jgi:hypothetical protein
MAALKLLRMTLRKKGAKLHAVYVGEREAHLALQAGDIPLRAITGSFQHEYARLFNRTHDEHRSLFRLHHHVLLIQHELWLVRLVHFIHWIRRLERPDEYSGGLWWSSDEVYRGGAKQDWVTTNVVLRMLTRGTYRRDVQAQAYRDLFDKAPDPRHALSFRSGSAEDPRLLGDPQFVRDMLLLTGRRSPDQVRRELHLEEDIRGAVVQVVDQFNVLCEERLEPGLAETLRRLVTYENVRSKSRKRPLPLVRALSVSYLIGHKVATPTQAAHFFGCSARPVSAPRRRFYMARFRKCFGVKSELLFCSRLEENDATRVHAP